MFLEKRSALKAGNHTIVNSVDGSVLASTTEMAFSSADRRRGLLGRNDLPAGHALIIAPCESVHTFFMRFAIDVVFVKRDGVVVKICRAVRPWRIAIGWKAYAVIELRADALKDKNVKIGDRLTLESA